MEFLKVFDIFWIENHLLYFSGVGMLVIIFLICKILKKVHTDIKASKRNSEEAMINMMRRTSKYNEEKKKLKFNEDD